MKGTRVDIIRQIQLWAESPDSPNILLLTGSAGTGKSTITRTIAEELEKEGKLKKKVADHIEFDLTNQRILTCKQHKLSITCTKLSWDHRYLYSASKDCAIVKWSLDDFRKVKFIIFKTKKKQTNTNDSLRKRHNSVINCLAVSSDNSYLISGDEKGIINVWRSEDLEFVSTLDGHKKSITDLAVCPSTNSLYSTSKDALVKVWNLNELGYMETLFGHQASVTSIDVVNSNKVVTAGGTDKTIRVWKIQEESHFIYNGHVGSIDIVRKLDEGFFISAGDDGCLCLWGALKKKPLYVEQAAHGLCSMNNQPNWITALAVFPNGDLIASGSCNGCIALWKFSHSSKMFHLLRTIPAIGYINSLHFTSNVKYLIVGIGREHRLGRWQSIEGIKNSILIIPLTLKE